MIPGFVYQNNHTYDLGPIRPPHQGFVLNLTYNPPCIVDNYCIQIMVKSFDFIRYIV